MNAPHSRSRTPRTLVAILAAGVALALSSTVAFAQVLDQVAGDAMAVVRIHDLAKVNTKAAALCQQFGVAQMKPELADPLAALQNELNIKAGLDTAGDFAFVLLDVADNDVLGYTLVPVMDYQAFLGNFGEVKKDGDLDVVHTKFPSAPEMDVYATHWGKYAAMSDEKKALANKPTGLKLSPAVAKQWDTQDAIVVGNMKVLGPKFLAQIQQHKQEFLDDFQKGAEKGGKLDAKYMPTAKAAMLQAVAGAEEFLKDCTGASLGIKLSDEGISTAFMGDFAPGSYIGKLVAETNTTNAPLLKGLPDAKYLWYGGGVMNGPAAFKVLDDALAPVLAELAKTGDDQKRINDLLNLMRKTMSAEKGITMGFVAPSGALGATSLFQQVGIIEGDADAIMAAQRATPEALKALQDFVSASNGGMVKSQITVTPEAKVVDGISFTEVNQKMDADANTPEAQQITHMMSTMYGPNGQQVFYGKLDDKHVIMAGGVDDATISSLIKSAKAGEDTLDKLPEVMEVTKNLPDTRAFAGYFALDQTILTVKNYMQQMGMPFPLTLPPSLPPIGGAVAVDGSSMRFEMYVPSKLVSGIVAAVLQTMGNMNGAQPGGPAGL